MPLPSDLSLVTEADIARLIASREQEGPNQDFKRETPRGDNAGRHEFAADVSAMANSGGGDLLLGLDEDGEGAAAAIVPFAGNADQEVRRLQDVLMHSVEPRLPGVQVVAIPVGGGSVIVVRAPQSWAGPHRVKTNQHFFVREGARKRQLDVPEIRGLFLRSESQAQRVRDFRTDRLGKLLAGETPERLAPGSLLVLHLVPTQAALGIMSVDPAPYMNHHHLPVLGRAGGNPRLNIDGALLVRNVAERGTHGYSQFFRSGFFESVKVEGWGGAEQRGALGSLDYEESVIAVVDAFRRELTRLGYLTEMTAMLSVLRADRIDLGVERGRFAMFEQNMGRFDRETLIVPDVLLMADEPVERALKPLFDQVWQAAGLLRSFNYDANGVWAPRK
jgi:hypothetical protein